MDLEEHCDDSNKNAVEIKTDNNGSDTSNDNNGLDKHNIPVSSEAVEHSENKDSGNNFASCLGKMIEDILVTSELKENYDRKGSQEDTSAEPNKGVSDDCEKRECTEHNTRKNIAPEFTHHIVDDNELAMKENEKKDSQEGSAEEMKQSINDENIQGEIDDELKKSHEESAEELKSYVYENDDSVEKKDEKIPNVADTGNAESKESVYDKKETMRNENTVAKNKGNASKTKKTAGVKHKKKTNASEQSKDTPSNLQLVLLPTQSTPGGAVQYTPVFVVPDQISADSYPNPVPTSSLQPAIQTVMSQRQTNTTSSITLNKTGIPIKSQKGCDTKPQSQPVLILPNHSLSGKQVRIPKVMQDPLGMTMPMTQSGTNKPPSNNETGTFNQYLEVTDSAKATGDGSAHSKTQTSSGASKVTGVILENKATGAFYVTDSVEEGNRALLSKILEDGQLQTHTSDVKNECVSKTKDVRAENKQSHEKLPMKKLKQSSISKSQSEIPKVDSTIMQTIALLNNNQVSVPLNKQVSVPLYNQIPVPLNNNQDNILYKKQDNKAKQKVDPPSSNIDQKVSALKRSDLSVMTPSQLTKLVAFPKTPKAPVKYCVCCGRKVLKLYDLNTEDMHRKGYPDILHRYGGITVNEEYDKICQTCNHEVTKIDMRLVKFFEMCQKSKKRRANEVPVSHLQNVMKVDKSTNTELEIVTEQQILIQENSSRNQRVLVNPVPGKLILPKEINSKIRSNVKILPKPGSSLPDISLSDISPKLLSDVMPKPKSAQHNILPKPDDAVNTVNDPVQKLIQHEAMTIDHDYHQSASDKDRTDLVKKVDLEQLKAKLYTDIYTLGVMTGSTKFGYRGKPVEIDGQTGTVMPYEEAVSQFEAQELKKTSKASNNLLARKLGHTSELLRGKKDYESLQTFDFMKIFVEFCENFPFLAKCFLVMTNVLPEKLDSHIPAFAMIYAALMRIRFNELNRVHRMVTRCLLENMVPKRVYNQLAHIGVSLSYTVACALQKDKNFHLNFPAGIMDLTPSRKVPEGSQRMRRMALQSQNLKQLTSKIKGKNLKRTALTDSPARNQGDGTESQAADSTGASPIKKVKTENRPLKAKKRRRENKLIKCDVESLMPSQHNHAFLDEATGTLKLKRRKMVLSTKTCDSEQSVSEWGPEDLQKCNISYNSDWISCSPCRILDQLSKKYEIPPLTVDQESVLGDLNELLDLDVDSGTLESEGAEETIENLTKTINLLEESARYIVENETRETQMMYECIIDWLRVILQMLIRQQTGLSTSREEEIRMVVAFTRCFGLHKQFGAIYPKALRVYTTKVTSTPPIRFLKRGRKAGDKVAVIAEIDGNQFPKASFNTDNQSDQDSRSSQENDMNHSNQVDDANQPNQNQSNQSEDKNQSDQDGSSPKSCDERLFERLAAEMLVEVPDSLYQDCMFGLVFYKTSVVITSLHITREHIRKLQMNLPLWASKHTGTIVYTKLYDLLKSSDRLEVMRFLTRLSNGQNSDEIDINGQNPDEFDTHETEIRTVKQEKIINNESIDKASSTQSGQVKNVSRNRGKSSVARSRTAKNATSSASKGSSPRRRQVQSQESSRGRKTNNFEKRGTGTADNDTGWNGDNDNYVVAIEDVSGNGEGPSRIPVTGNRTGSWNRGNSRNKTADDVVLLEEASDNIELYGETVLVDGVQESEGLEVQSAVEILESLQRTGFKPLPL